MIMLRDISIMWSLIHTLVMFLFLFESRYPKKKTLTLTLFAMIPLILINFVLFIVYGTEKYLNLMLATLSLPSFIFFWFLAKHRGGQFVFTFCMVDTIVLEITYITSIVEYHIPGDTYIFIFVTRLLVYPLLEWFICRKFRFIYRNIQNEIKKGWWIFAVIGAMFYVAMAVYMSYPTMITERPEYLPVLIILFLLMPISYINIFNALRQQQNVHKAAEQENILRVQVADITTRIEEFSQANDKFRMERHDFRHKMQAITKMVENKEYEKLCDLVSEYSVAMQETSVKRYCDNAVLDAILSSYLSRAESKGIKVTTAITFPEKLNASDTELATVFANAIENAINACEKVDKEKRFIDIKVLSQPQFMMQVCNSYDGNAEFDHNGMPVTHEEGHGFGTRSIAAFCEKYGAFHEFRADGEKFLMRIIIG